MKNGLTLVELIATIVILSIIAVIVTPNILVSMKQYKEQINDSNLKSIESAAKNWTADHIDDPNFPTDEDSSIIVTIDELEKDGYIKDNLKDVLNGGKFNDKEHFTFVVINCILIKDELGNEVINYAYNYNVYTSINNFITTKSIDYAKSSNVTKTSTISYSELLSEGYIKNNIYYSEDKSIELGKTKLIIDPISSITITVEEYGKTDEKTYEYSATVNWKK